LIKEWLPALKGTPGCVEVELLDTYWSRAGFIVTELWESREAHENGVKRLWRGERMDLFDKAQRLAHFDFIWECTVIAKEGK